MVKYMLTPSTDFNDSIEYRLCLILFAEQFHNSKFLVALSNYIRCVFQIHFISIVFV